MVSKEILHVVRPRLRCALPAAGPATHALCACLIPPGRLLLPVVATADALMGCFCNKLMNDSLVAK